MGRIGFKDNSTEGASTYAYMTTHEQNVYVNLAGYTPVEDVERINTVGCYRLCEPALNSGIMHLAIYDATDPSNMLLIGEFMIENDESDQGYHWAVRDVSAQDIRVEKGKLYVMATKVTEGNPAHTRPDRIRANRWHSYDPADDIVMMKTGLRTGADSWPAVWDLAADNDGSSSKSMLLSYAETVPVDTGTDDPVITVIGQNDTVISAYHQVQIHGLNLDGTESARVGTPELGYEDLTILSVNSELVTCSVVEVGETYLIFYEPLTLTLTGTNEEGDPTSVEHTMQFLPPIGYQAVNGILVDASTGLVQAGGSEGDQWVSQVALSDVDIELRESTNLTFRGALDNGTELPYWHKVRGNQTVWQQGKIQVNRPEQKEGGNWSGVLPALAPRCGVSEGLNLTPYISGEPPLTLEFVGEVDDEFTISGSTLISNITEMKSGSFTIRVKNQWGSEDQEMFYSVPNAALSNPRVQDVTQTSVKHTVTTDSALGELHVIYDTNGTIATFDQVVSGRNASGGVAEQHGYIAVDSPGEFPLFDAPGIDSGKTGTIQYAHKLPIKEDPPVDPPVDGEGSYFVDMGLFEDHAKLDVQTGAGTGNGTWTGGASAGFTYGFYDMLGAVEPHLEWTLVPPDAESGTTDHVRARAHKLRRHIRMDFPISSFSDNHGDLWMSIRIKDNYLGWRNQWGGAALFTKPGTLVGVLGGDFDHRWKSYKFKVELSKLNVVNDQYRFWLGDNYADHTPGMGMVDKIYLSETEPDLSAIFPADEDGTWEPSPASASRWDNIGNDHIYRRDAAGNPVGGAEFVFGCHTDVGSWMISGTPDNPIPRDGDTFYELQKANVTHIVQHWWTDTLTSNIKLYEPGISDSAYPWLPDGVVRATLGLPEIDKFCAYYGIKWGHNPLRMTQQPYMKNKGGVPGVLQRMRDEVFPLQSSSPNCFLFNPVDEFEHDGNGYNKSWETMQHLRAASEAASPEVPVLITSMGFANEIGFDSARQMANVVWNDAYMHQSGSNSVPRKDIEIGGRQQTIYFDQMRHMYTDGKTAWGAILYWVNNRGSEIHPILDEDRVPNELEMVWQFYYAVCCGASATVYFVYCPPDRPEIATGERGSDYDWKGLSSSWDGLRRAGLECNGPEGIGKYLVGTSNTTLDCKSDMATVGDNGHVIVNHQWVRFILKGVGGVGTMLIAVNMRRSDIGEVTFTVPNISQGLKTGHFDTPDVTVDANQQFKHTFTKHERAIWWLEGGPT